ncbi:MAG TPA: hypothetical protein VKT32_11300, partial [Chthonomonadaceae bacterium]|nr:hypothetical protein [Chthonomonadaceae bacterium]
WVTLRHRLMAYAGPVIDDDRPGHQDNPGYLLSQFSISLLWLAPWGAYGLFRRRRRLFGLMLLIYLVTVAWALNYNIPNIDVYYIPSHMILALWIGCGLRQLSLLLARLWRRMAVPRKSRRRLISGFGTALVGLPLMLLALNWHTDDARQDQSATTLGHAILDALKPHAVLLCDGDEWVFSEIYPHYLENRRPDVTIIPLLHLIEPTDVRLITRLSAQGLVVRVPEGYAQKSLQAKADTRLLVRFIKDNLGGRPLYMAGQKIEAIAHLPEIRDAIPALIPVAASQPFFEIDAGGHAASAQHAPGDPQSKRLTTGEWLPAPASVRSDARLASAPLPAPAAARTAKPYSDN